MNLPIRTRLTLWYVALLALVLLALGVFLVVRLRAGLIRGADEGLETRAAQISLGLQNGCEGEFQDVSDASLVGLPQGESGAQLLSSDGRVLESSGDPVAGRPMIGRDAITRVLGGSTVRTTIGTGRDREPFRVLAVGLPAGTCDGVIVVTTSLEDVDRSVRELMVLLFIGGPAVLVLAGAGGWWLARRALAPVARMTEEADEIGIERLDERIDVPPTSDELQHLAVTLNSMLDRLERGVEDKRRFVADASHELRTPLAVMRSELDVSLRSNDLTPGAREVLRSAEEEVERMRSIVENLLTLARADAGALPLLRARANLRDMADAVISAAEPLAEPHCVRIVAEGPRVDVEVDRARIEQVLSNLVSNAVRFSPRDGVVRVLTWAKDGAAGCTVSDDGPGVPQAMVGRIFEPFVRADPARASDGGSGLGLAICRKIVTAHRGRIWLETQPGRGSAFSFSLPAEGLKASP